MAHLSRNQIDAATHTDIQTYLSSRGIMLKQVGKEYLWSDQNVWIHGHEWYSHYDQTGATPYHL